MATIASCGACLCRNCLRWWSNRCPYGGCYDDYRAEVNPYDKAHPDKPPRTLWSEWNRPGEQAHWCRGGIFYPTETCEHHIPYQHDKVKVVSCFDSNVVVYQDGYIQCSIIDSVGCQECWRRFQEKRRKHHDKE